MINESTIFCGICQIAPAKPFLSVRYSCTNSRIMCCSKSCLDFYLFTIYPPKDRKKVSFRREDKKSNIYEPKPHRVADVDRVKKLILSAQEDDI